MIPSEEVLLTKKTHHAEKKNIKRPPNGPDMPRVREIRTSDVPPLREKDHRAPQLGDTIGAPVGETLSLGNSTKGKP